MTKLAPHEAKITDWLAAQQEAMLALLARGREHRQRQLRQGRRRRGGRALHALLPASTACRPAVEPHERFGDAIHIRLDDKPSNERPIVLMGHRDTVFPKGEVARRPFRIEDGRAYGPGVADMKAGLVINAFVLAAFKRFGGAPAPLAGLITSDEEIASPSSRPVIERVGAPGALRVQLRARPAQRQRRHRRARAACSCAFEVTGKAAHSGGNFEKGISAIGELAHKIVAMHALTDLQARHHRQCRPRQGRAVRQHHGAASPRARSTCATSSREQRATALAALQEIIDTRHGPRHDRQARDHAASSCRSTDAGGRGAVRHLPGGGRRCRPRGRRRVHRRLRRFRLHRRRSAARPCAASARSAPTRTRRRSTWRSTPSCRAPRPWRWPSCACLPQGG